MSRAVNRAASGVILAVICVVLIVLRGSVGGSYAVTAVFSSAQGLFTGANVMVAGLPVGHVSRITIGTDGLPHVQMQIDDDIRLDRSATADLRLLSNSGELNRVIELTLGHGHRLSAGSLIPLSQTSAPVELDQVLDIFSPATRADVRSVFASIDNATSGLAPAFEASLKNSSAALSAAASVLQEITADGTSLHELVDQGDIALSAFARNRAALGNAVDQLSGLLSVTAGRYTDLRDAVRWLPAGLRGPTQVLDGLAAATPTLRRLVGVSAPAVDQLGPTARSALPALKAAEPLLSRLAEALRTAPTALHALRPLLQATQSVAKLLGPLSTAALPVLDELRVYTPEIAGLLSDWADAESSYDAAGHAMRLLVSSAPVPSRTVASDSMSSGYISAPYVRDPGTLVEQPWDDYQSSFLSKRSSR